MSERRLRVVVATPGLDRAVFTPGAPTETVVAFIRNGVARSLPSRSAAGQGR